ncbi:MAG TPA: DICT sensory domain-containing protein [Solirubrobacterales bacterium]|nr:DICT sensory domain-containing protein [Solirubrobacterales bacterium]
MSNFDENLLSIGDVVRATGISEATLRAWERRYDFPQPRREPSGHRRYRSEEVERILRVVAERERGIALPVAIGHARLAPSGIPSLFAQLRERRPDLQQMTVRKRHLTPLARAVEEESAARAERALLIGSFQRERFYRQSESRWRELAAGAEGAFVFADFERLRQPRGAPAELPVDRSHPVSREWALVCAAPEHGVCMVAWEPPGRSHRSDAEREFELLLSVEPAVVREAAETAAALAAPLAPDVAERSRGYLEQLAPPRAESQLRLSSSITARLLSSLSQSLNRDEKGKPGP